MSRLVTKLAIVGILANSAPAQKRDLESDLSNLNERHKTAHYVLAGTVSDAKLKDYGQALEFVNEPLCLHHFTAGSLARTDRQANLSELRRVLLRIKAAFGDLNRTQRRAVHRNLATCSLQLGFDHYKTRKYAAAAKYFTESFRFHPRWRTAVDAIQAERRALFSREEAPVPKSC